MEAGQFEEIDGVRYHFRRKGVGTPLLLLHGLAASSYSFRELVPRLASDFDVVALDLIGFGLSDRSPDRGDYRIPVQVERILRLLDRLGIERFSVCGHSFGAVIAAGLAREAPDRVDRLVFVSPPPRFDPPPWYLRNGVALRAACLATRLLLANPRRFRELFGRAFHRRDAFTEEDSETYRRLLRHGSFADAFYGYAIAIGGPNAAAPAYQEVRHPILVLGGEKDGIVEPEALRELVANLAEGRLELLPDCGHSAPEEYPERVAEVVRSFCGA